VLTVLTDNALADPGQVMEFDRRRGDRRCQTVVAVRVGGTSSSNPPRRGGARVAVFSFPNPPPPPWRPPQVRSDPFGSLLAVSRPTGIRPVGGRRGDRPVRGRWTGMAGRGRRRSRVGGYGIPVCAQRVVTDVEQRRWPAPNSAIRWRSRSPRAPGAGPRSVASEWVSATRRHCARPSRRGRGGRRIHPVLVQPMAPPGIEMIIGAVQDERFGPVVMVGAGGILADVIADRHSGLAVVHRRCPRDARELRTGPLLMATGAAEVSRDALCDRWSGSARCDGLPCVANST